jgi:hypothetical protein
MADQKISDLTEVTTPLVGDFLAIVSGGATKKVSAANLRKILEWDQYITKSVAQDVINTVTPADDNELQFAMINGEVWFARLDLIYSASGVGVDYRLNCVLPTAQGWLRGQSLTTADAAQQTSVALVAATSITDITIGTLAALGNVRHAIFEFGFAATANATFKMQFANGTAGVGNTSRTGAGSMLRAKKLL